MELKFVKIRETSPDLPKLLCLNEEAFPKEERIPSEHMLPLLDAAGCDLWGVYDAEFLGFVTAFFDPGSGVCYIGFLAVEAAQRGRGIGSKILAQLKDVYPNSQLVLEIEHMDPAAQNFAQRKTRLQFYERNGFHYTGYGLSYFGVDYDILCSEPDFRREAFQQILDGFDVPNFHPTIYAL